MKKSIKKSSRRKWVVGGVAFFGSIALLTTGFATWVVGVQQDSDTGDVTVNVDTVKNNSVLFDITVDPNDNSITLAEESTIEAGKNTIVSTEEGGLNADFKISLSKVNIEIGKQALSNYNKIVFEIAAQSGDYANNEVSNNDTGLRDGSGSWDYLALVTKEVAFKNAVDNSALKDWTRDPSGDIESASTVKYTNSSAVTIEFEWGDYFGGNDTSPATFYNNHYAELSSDLSGSVAKINSEMAAMQSAFDGHPLLLTAKLSK